ncbi:hypothetical protein NLJ89_g6224 [Agrocybe chaxingu]|uniref:Uncharacterized protein n=1 Tax=Agrocybe chaxingu TaxID=84603 RepID=A0A9W8JZJ4_9AGAR|nr:hypothetical protein NLJ89_g6224 [Agrocybe chaxingu]
MSVSSGPRVGIFDTYAQLLFDGGKVVDCLKIVKTFLDASPNEMNNIILEDRKPRINAQITLGITPMAYVPPSLPVKQSHWPTLGAVIDSDKRLVVFLDAGADTSSVSFILPEFQMIWETPFSVTDASFPCSVDRINGPLATADHTYMINHSLNKNIIPTGGGVIVSDPLGAPTTNGVPSIMANVQKCLPLGADRNLQFILLDFVNIGEGFEAAAMLNGLAMSVVDPNTTIDNQAPNGTTTNSAEKNSDRTKFDIPGTLDDCTGDRF